MTTAQKIDAIKKSIELQNRTKKNIESSRVPRSEVDGMDIDRMLATCDEIIAMLENRIIAIQRREAAKNAA